MRIPEGRLEIEPDRRILKAIERVFVNFRECGSIRQVLLWFRQERIELPTVGHGASGLAVIWKLPVHNVVHHILTNPIYAAAYAPSMRPIPDFAALNAELARPGVTGVLLWQEYKAAIRMAGSTACSASCSGTGA